MRRALSAIVAVLLGLGGAEAAEASVSDGPILCALDYPRPGVLVDYFVFVNLNIAMDGSLKWNDTPVSGNDFASYLGDVRTVDPRPVFRIAVEPRTPFSVVATVLRKIQASGVRMMFLGVRKLKNNMYSHVVGCAVVDHWRNRMPAITHIHVKPDSTLFWNGQKIDQRVLSEYLSAIQKDKPQPVINISPDPNTPYERLLALLSEIYRHEIRDVVLGPYGRYVEEPRRAD